MTRGELIKTLEAAPQDRLVPHGFGRPHSYRGYYDQLAFEPRENVTVAEMLADAEGALWKTFKGYKGGDYAMEGHTEVWLAEYGECGETLGPVLLRYMLNEEVARECEPSSEPRSIDLLIERLEDIAKKNNDRFSYKILVDPDDFSYTFVCEETADNHAFVTGYGASIEEAVQSTWNEIELSCQAWNYHNVGNLEK